MEIWLNKKQACQSNVNCSFISSPFFTAFLLYTHIWMNGVTFFSQTKIDAVVWYVINDLKHTGTHVQTQIHIHTHTFHYIYIDVDITDIDKTCEQYGHEIIEWQPWAATQYQKQKSRGEEEKKPTNKHKHINWKVNYSLIGFCMYSKLLLFGQKWTHTSNRPEQEQHNNKNGHIPFPFTRHEPKKKKTRNICMARKPNEWIY